MEARVPVAPGFDEVRNLIRLAVIENSRVNPMAQRIHGCLLRGYSWLMIRSYCKCRANERRNRCISSSKSICVKPSKRISSARFLGDSLGF